MNYIDITRLCSRAQASSPSGIDRVDLAYLKWLRESGPVDYLINGKCGFTQVERMQGNAFLDAIISKWQGDLPKLDLNEISILHDTSHRYRKASKWWTRRNKLEKILSIRSLTELCQFHTADLSILDASADPLMYRVDPAWRIPIKNSCYFGISHSILSRTAYMKKLAKHKHLKRVFFIHDTIPCDFPEFCRSYEGAKHLLRIQNAFRYGTHIVVNSEYTKQRLDFWRTHLGEKEIPVEVIPIGVDEGLLAHVRASAFRSATKRPYFVILGTIEPRKNHALLLDIWINFTKTLPKEAIPELLIIGKRGWENESVFQTLDYCESLHGHVREMNHVTDEDLWPLLQGAHAMLFPSFVEGWGMPLVEALTLGIPVIASDIPAFHEAGQGIPDLIPPTNTKAWAQQIVAYTELQSSAKSDQQHRLLNYRPPTWADHLSKVEAMLGCRSC
jgi:glycosyltransferase involved in cell wall biosynthesis